MTHLSSFKATHFGWGLYRLVGTLLLITPISVFGYGGPEIHQYLVLPISVMIGMLVLSAIIFFVTKSDNLIWATWRVAVMVVIVHALQYTSLMWMSITSGQVWYGGVSLMFLSILGIPVVAKELSSLP